MNEVLHQALCDVLSVADDLQTRLLLVGAWARDLCLPEEKRGLSRKTNDADLAVLLEDWSAVDAFFDACAPHFEEHRDDLFLRHRQVALKVDVIPCGGIESPSGSLALRASTRVLNTAGLAEAFEHASTLDLGSHTLLVPTPNAFVLLKLLSFLDRRAPRDLRDLGYVVSRAPVDDAEIWSDEEVLDRLADGRLTLDDMAAWQLGRNLSREFSGDTSRKFLGALAELQQEPDAIRSLLSEGREPTERLLTADRWLRLLVESVSG